VVGNFDVAEEYQRLLDGRISLPFYGFVSTGSARLWTKARPTDTEFFTEVSAHVEMPRLRLVPNESITDHAEMPSSLA